MLRDGEKTLRALTAPIMDALRDPKTTEIVIQRPGEVGIERGGEWEWVRMPEYDFRRLDALSLLCGSLISKRFDRAHPILLASLPVEGNMIEARYTVIGPPVTQAGTMTISIRVPPQNAPTFQDDDITEVMGKTSARTDAPDPADEELLALYDRAATQQDPRGWVPFLARATAVHKTIGATGETNSGKTYTLRRCMQEIPDWERVVTIEDTYEFGRLKESLERNRVSWLWGSAGVTPEALAEAALRMRPDRVAFQELRGAEAFGFMKILAAGHGGGLTTWHASQKDWLTPLTLMCKQHPAGRVIPDDKLERLLRELIDIVVFCYCHPITKRFSIPSVYYRAAAERGQRFT